MTHFDFVVHSGKLVKIYARLLGTPDAISNQQMEEKRQKTMVTKTVDFVSIVCVLPLTFHNLRRKQSKIVRDGIFSPNPLLQLQILPAVNYRDEKKTWVFQLSKTFLLLTC